MTNLQTLLALNFDDPQDFHKCHGFPASIGSFGYNAKQGHRRNGCLEIYSPISTNVTVDTRLPAPKQLDLLVLELYLAFINPAHNYDSVSFWVYYYDGVNSYRPAFRYRPNVTTLEYMNAAGTYTTISSALILGESKESEQVAGDEFNIYTQWHRFRTIFDFNKKVYKTLEVNNLDYTSTIKDLTLATAVAATTPHTLRVEMNVQAGGAGTIYRGFFDDILLQARGV